MGHLLTGFRGSEVESWLACRDGGPLIDVARELQVPVYRVGFDKRFRPGPARAVAALVAGSAIDLVHAHGLVATTYCTLARAFGSLRVPLLYHQHGFHDHNYGRLTHPLRTAAERAVCRRADRVIAVSSADAVRLAAEAYVNRDRIELIPYGLPAPAAAAEEVELARDGIGLPRGRPVVGLVGRLHPQKGIDVFLAAAARVAGQVPEALFVVVGTGAAEAPLRELAQALGLARSLRWAGGRPAAAFLPLLDIAVLASHWEGLPLVLLEYMASGRSIVTTDVPGCLDAVGPQEAEIVPRGDPAAMAEAILRLLRSPALAAAHGQAARRRFEQHFTLTAMVSRFAAVYRGLLR